MPVPGFCPIRKAVNKHRRTHLYYPLDSKAGEIRLLTVEPGRREEHLSCSLHVASLSEGSRPIYDTISYHWGGSVTSGPYVKIDGKKLPKGRYCDINGVEFILPLRTAQAIRCMRDPLETRTVWIDTVCINQDDVVERQEQIALMGEIYKYGTSNLIHLGIDEHGEAAMAKAALKEAKKRLKRHLEALPQEAQRQWHNHRIKPDGWGKLEKPPVLLDNPAQLQVIFKCAWFTRLWVVQEACLAAENICRWGDHKFKLQDLMDVVHISRELDAIVEAKDRELSKAYFAAQQLRYSLLLSDGFRESAIENVPETLLDLVDMARQSKVTQEHDRVFALTGLLRSFENSGGAQSLLNADYSKALPKVLQDSTRAILQLTRTDDLLSRIAHRTQSDLFDVKKPSWSVYWDRPRDVTLEPARPPLYTTFHAGIAQRDLAGHSPLVIAAVDDESSILRLRGYMIGSARNLTGPVKGGSLVNDSKATMQLIDTTLEMTRAQYKNRKSGMHHRADSALGSYRPTLENDAKAEALRAREKEKSNEVIRRRVNRRLGEEEIVAYEKRSGTTSSTRDSQTSSSDSPQIQDVLEDRIDTTAISTLSQGWWAVQFASDERVALKAFRDLREHMKQHSDLSHVLSEAFNMHVVISCCANHR